MKNKLPITLGFFVLLTACSQNPSPQEMAVMSAQAEQSMKALNGVSVKQVAYQTPITVSDVISSEDVLDVNVFKVPDLSAQKITVETSGVISLPLIGSVKVQGLTITQAEREITQRLQKFMQDPKVSVTRTEKAISKRVTVEGEVRTPGVFPIKGNLSFLQAIAMSQGLTEVADARGVLLFRDGAQHNVNLELIRTGRIVDPVLRNDDRIVVLKDESKVREKKVIEYLPAVLSPFSLLVN